MALDCGAAAAPPSSAAGGGGCYHVCVCVHTILSSILMCKNAVISTAFSSRLHLLHRSTYPLACAFDPYSIHYSLYDIQTGEKYADATSINHSPVFPPLVSNLDCHRIEVVEKHALKHELLTCSTKKKKNIKLVGMNES